MFNVYNCLHTSTHVYTCLQRTLRPCDAPYAMGVTPEGVAGELQLPEELQLADPSMRQPVAAVLNQPLRSTTMSVGTMLKKHTVPAADTGTRTAFETVAPVV